MDANEIYTIITKKMGKDWYNVQENETLDLILNKKEGGDKLNQKELDKLLKFLEGCKNELKMEDDVSEDVKRDYEDIISEITLKQLLKPEKKKKERLDGQQVNKVVQIANSNILEKDQHVPSWSPQCLIGMPVSFSKRIDIAPDIYNNEEEKSTFSLIFKSRGLKSDTKPLSINFAAHEFMDFILANLIMMSVFDSKSILPFELCTPDDCHNILEKWTKESAVQIGDSILSYFELTAKSLGALFKRHMEKVAKANKKKISVDEQNLKRKGGEENPLDIWASRKKSYMNAVKDKAMNKY